MLTHTGCFNNSPGFTVSQDIGWESQEANDSGLEAVVVVVVVVLS